MRRKARNPINDALTLPGGRTYIPGRVIYASNPYELQDWGKATYAELFVSTTPGMKYDNISGEYIPIRTVTELARAKPFPIEDLIRYMKSRWEGLSIINQTGIYKGREEPSYRIIIYHDPSSASYKSFKTEIQDTAEKLAGQFLQQQVIIHLVAEGSDDGTEAVQWVE